MLPGYNSGKKKEHKDKLFGSGDRPVEWHAKGRWPKSSRPPTKVCLPCVSKEGNLWDVPRILLGCPGLFGGVQKVCAKKVRAHFSFTKGKGPTVPLTSQSPDLPLPHGLAPSETMV